MSECFKYYGNYLSLKIFAKDITTVANTDIALPRHRPLTNELVFSLSQVSRDSSNAETETKCNNDNQIRKGALSHH